MRSLPASSCWSMKCSLGKKIYLFIPCIAFPETFVYYRNNQFPAVIQDCPECPVIYISNIRYPVSFLVSSYHLWKLCSMFFILAENLQKRSLQIICRPDLIPF